jgi:hypothetical protein
MVPISPDVNYLHEWTQHPDDLFVLGIDWGYDHDSGYSLNTWNPARHPHFINLEAWSRERMKLSDHLEAIKGYMARYPNLRVVADSSGGTKAIVAELRDVHGIPIEAADKQGKRFQLSHCLSDAVTGILKIYNIHDPAHPEQNALAQQWNRLMWKIDPRTKKKHEGTPRHISDATVYARQAAAPDLHREPEADTRTDSQKRREKKQERLLKKRLLRRGRRQ